LFVVGDSLCIGADRPGKNWPDLLGDLAGMEVRNFSFGGARVETAMANAVRINQDDALVILEIGGNDLLGGTSIPKYRQDLEKMLTLVCRPNRRVVMIELPLPPLFNRFGMVQRALAKSHGVTLIPKQTLAGIISTPGATVDGLHLSNTGHIMLAQSLFAMLARPDPGNTAPVRSP
jgi:acyl-CoA thioesterase-1